jgi:hypothetical protein
MSAFLTEARVALRACKATTDYYRVQVKIQKHATPADIAALHDEEDLGNEEFRKWIAGLYANVVIAQPAIQNFRFQRLADSVSLYTGLSAGKVLVTGFCGQAHLPFMPVAMMLQYYDPERHTFLLLRDESRAGFIEGMANRSNSFREMASRLSQELDFGRYDEVRTFGTSGGGAAALAFGELVGATCSVAFAGHLPSASPRYGADPLAADLEALLHDATEGNGRACVYSADNPIDARNAIALAAAIPSRLLPIPGISDHNVVFELHQRRQLAAVLDTVGLTG